MRLNQKVVRNLSIFTDEITKSLQTIDKHVCPSLLNKAPSFLAGVGAWFVRMMENSILFDGTQKLHGFLFSLVFHFYLLIAQEKGGGTEGGAVWMTCCCRTDCCSLTHKMQAQPPVWSTFVLRGVGCVCIWRLGKGGGVYFQSGLRGGSPLSSGTHALQAQ